LEEVMTYSASAAEAAYEQAARALCATPAAGDWVGAAVDAVREIAGAIDIRQPLRELGVTRDLLPTLAADAVADAVTRNSPRHPTEPEVLEILHSAY
jgi:alcohol dehydrogenase class IV